MILIRHQVNYSLHWVKGRMTLTTLNTAIWRPHCTLQKKKKKNSNSIIMCSCAYVILNTGMNQFQWSVQWKKKLLLITITNRNSAMSTALNKLLVIKTHYFLCLKEQSEFDHNFVWPSVDLINSTSIILLSGLNNKIFIILHFVILYSTVTR